MKDVARAVQTDARRRDILPEVERRLAALDRPRRPTAARWAFGLAGAAACAAAVGLVFFRPVPISYSVSLSSAADAAKRGNVGERLVAPAAGALALKFSDGSEVTLPSRAQAHVDGLDARGATLAVEEGTIEVSVVHRAHTRWEVRAGRYWIHVTGTKFSTGWDQHARTFVVTMHEGSVVVTGPGLKQPTRVVGGQRLRANMGVDLGVEEPVISIDDANAPETPATESAHATEPIHEARAPRAAPEAEPAERPVAAASARESHAPARASHHAVAAVAPQTVARTESGWRLQATQGQFRDALASAIREGWSDDCDRLGTEDVLRLGDIARLAGDPSRAEEAYRAASRRFPTADRPIFSLGKVAFDSRHDYAAAAHWFEEYLRRFPRGALVQEATGRLLEARIKTGDIGAAHDVATSYLRSFPNGPHAELARRTVGR
jgi:TolA-binding protein